jgi:hypothetical protein
MYVIDHAMPEPSLRCVAYKTSIFPLCEILVMMVNLFGCFQNIIFSILTLFQ